MTPPLSSSCPTPPAPGDQITLAHGEGGRLMRRLIRDHIVSRLTKTQGNGAMTPDRDCMGDAAEVPVSDATVAVTTDSFVVAPLFFPGGDIGSLAVYGTVNDLAVAGARPIGMTLSLIIEEGLPIQTLDQIVDRIADAAEIAGVQIICGDTKVVPVGAADKLFINTTGVGVYQAPRLPGPTAIRESDVLIVSGPIGRHGIAVLAAREELGFQPPPESDCASLVEATARLHAELGQDLVAMRDATRGGVSAVLHEWAEDSGKTMQLQESAIPVTSVVRGACELLGLDPLYVANEGTFVAVVRPSAAVEAINLLRSVDTTQSAVVVGKAVAPINSPVVIERLLGTLQPVDEPAGAPLPRVC